jgi:uncharacterized protein YndB with AHSA1/START domain
MKSLRRGAVLLALACAASSARAEGVEVRLSERTHAAYVVEGSFRVAASSAAVWAVLTDYDHIADFVPSMRESRAVEARPDGSRIVAQRAVGSVLFFSKSLRVRLEVRREGEERLRFIDLDHKDFRVYAGSWRVRAVPGCSLVDYRLEAEPDFLTPALLMRRGLKRGASDLLDEVRAEILRRSGGRRP